MPIRNLDLEFSNLFRVKYEDPDYGYEDQFKNLEYFVIGSLFVLPGFLLGFFGIKDGSTLQIFVASFLIFLLWTYPVQSSIETYFEKKLGSFESAFEILLVFERYSILPMAAFVFGEFLALACFAIYQAYLFLVAFSTGVLP